MYQYVYFQCNDFLEVITVTHIAGNFSLLILNCQKKKIELSDVRVSFIMKLDVPSLFIEEH